MSEKEEKIPIRRFKEFEHADAWEQRKLGEEAEILAGGDVDKSKLKKSGKYPVFANALTDDGLVGYYENDYRIEAPAVTVTGRGDIGHAQARKTNFTPVVRLLAVKSKHDVDFLENAINNHRVLVESTGVPQLTSPQLANYRIYFSNFEEEAEIGGLFSQLEHLITLHQRKLEKIKSLKKAYLSEMFPAKGECKPKRRFAGYTDAWEQRKLGEVLESMQNNTLSRAELSTEQGIAKNVHYGDILVKFGEVLSIANEQLPMMIDDTVVAKYKSSFLQNGDVVIADTAEDETVGKCTEIADLQGEIVISGLHTIPYRPLFKFASGYLGYYMNSVAYHNQLIPLMQGIKVTSISKSAMQNTDIVYPKSVEEQKKIGEYFRNLDHLITLHQRKLEKLQSLKQAYLNEMFV